MGFGKLVVIGLHLLINALLCLGRKKPGSDVLYQCIEYQTCNCNKPDRFESCYGYLTKTSQRWIVDKFNACSSKKLDYDGPGEGLRSLCSTEDKEFERCYNELLSHFKKRYMCLEAIVSFCEANPEGCMR
ncbi:unnamed protein product [Larinioides sclopetarius]|uniref:Uncharacterized protein n=1 Tax=Larinioides sclopetarius TaxID=280406 RepID=A0AAV2ADS5_9ARAC